MRAPQVLIRTIWELRSHGLLHDEKKNMLIFYRALERSLYHAEWYRVAADRNCDSHILRSWPFSSHVVGLRKPTYGLLHLLIPSDRLSYTIEPL